MWLITASRKKNIRVKSYVSNLRAANRKADDTTIAIFGWIAHGVETGVYFGTISIVDQHFQRLVRMKLLITLYEIYPAVGIKMNLS